MTGCSRFEGCPEPVTNIAIRSIANSDRGVPGPVGSVDVLPLPLGQQVIEVPRPGQLKSVGGERFSDRIALGVLTRAFPPELVDEVVAECGRVEKRQRQLPARVVVFFVLAMCLFSGQGYEEVARLLTQGLERERRWAKGWHRRRLLPCQPLPHIRPFNSNVTQHTASSANSSGPGSDSGRGAPDVSR
ncbi:transposase domain-containing protein [Streptomyces sp. H27-D2]|uniref:transposase domain-containing protein n=1 Tax=Streptomyces sp. H27-D2 TaxID=3046304 RepID=UPI002DB6AC62|nr:transposase domain-containing protein [Streptomyces sp. H27-D2]MEC4019181.1 transposase domain-containing protein [Streptomyces sp. H27-D2]